ncbi:DUF418 domain-containing protein [Actinopolymorpha pittospori]|uniref:DUF418 domain-containing protein n=1 Tax=Actinopolymorpha pittospori TaxID=648752 RepID=A0A927RHR9_9ACTN|nr:DUF418 domain-containing protein [Actinopolymorpha pittospori]MBE1612510.1 uncharacterized protein [Actinopolymorpha pittospori]
MTELLRQRARPKAPTYPRILALDVLRGLAILGTLGTNVWIFTNPEGPPSALEAPTTDTLAGAVEMVLRFFANGKALALLTLLFGIGLELQYRSARKRGRRWPGWYLWRAGLLFVEGLLHYVLVFEFDVLMAYALTSVVVAFLVGRSDRAVRWWMIVVGTLHLLFVGLVTLGMSMVSASNQPLVVPSRPDLFTHGGYLEQLSDRLTLAPFYRLEAIFILPLGIVLFLAGSRLLRAGVFDDTAKGARIRARLMVVGLGVAFPLNAVTMFVLGPSWALVDRYVLAPVVAFGLLGLVTTLLHRMRAGRPGILRRGLTAVGRTALSCYVFQNLLAAVLCYGWGLGLTARLEGARPWWVIGAYVGIVALFMSLSSLWLRRFDRGPLELMWQWAYQAPQRRRPAAGSTPPPVAAG